MARRNRRSVVRTPQASLGTWPNAPIRTPALGLRLSPFLAPVTRPAQQNTIKRYSAPSPALGPSRAFNPAQARAVSARAAISPLHDKPDRKNQSAKKDARHLCKSRPDGNKRRSGGGGSKRFVPWC